MDNRSWIWLSVLVGGAFMVSMGAGLNAPTTNGSQPARSTARNPERIISLDNYSTEILCELGVSDKIVAIGETREGSPYHELLKDKPRAGSFFNVALERVLSHEPDLVCCYTGVADVLKQHGLVVFPIPTCDIAGIMEVVSELGKMVRQEERAEEIVTRMKERIASVEERVESVILSGGEESRPLVYFEAYSPGRSRSSGSLTHELITRAGGVNIAGDEPVAFALLSSEFIIEKNPDVIIVEEYGASPEGIRNRDGWSNIEAVKNNRIHVSRSYFTGYTPRCIDGLEQYARWFYP